MIAGLAAFVAGGTRIRSQDLRFDLAWLGLSALLVVLASLDAVITPAEALTFFVLFGMYVVAMYGGALHGSERHTAKLKTRDWVMLGVGFAALIGGAHFLVEATIHIASVIGVATGIISLLAIAVGTSLPEMFVTVQAARGGKPDLAIGNIFGSNVFNALVVLGGPGLMGVMPLESASHTVGLLFMTLATLALIWAGVRGELKRNEGLLLMVMYVFFLALATGWI